MNPSFAHFRRALHAPGAAILLAVTVAGPAWAQAITQAPELQAAQRAVDRAGQADADQYAPDLIETARQTLSQAQAAVADRRQRKQAPALALRAAAEADLARARSEAEQTDAQLRQRRGEIAGLRRKLGLEDAP
ncbi:MAG: DUF4398 domain-containing protein [Pseudoxanthomonas sp.]